MATTYIHFSAFKNIDSSVVKRVGRRGCDVVRHSGCCIGLPRSWSRCLPPGPGKSRRPGGGLPEQHSRGQYIRPIRNTERKQIIQINGTKILITPHIHSYFHIFLHTCTYLIYYTAYKNYKRHEFLYVCMIMRLPLLCPGPGYWLLSRRVVLPPQSDLWKQLLSGEFSHPIRHKKGHHITHVSHAKVDLYIQTYIHTYIHTNIYNTFPNSNFLLFMDVQFYLSIFATTKKHNYQVHTLFSIQKHWLFSSSGFSTLMWCSGCCICLPWSWPRCLPPGPGRSRRPGGGLPQQPSGGQSIHPFTNTERQHVKQFKMEYI